ncbi:unnamed protein product [Danaus chrysippus]|uniref:(African queen) hypothetical protein n=1 Tax=Danaus chrysippus TaxID=151541 RepID=A0A8J2QBS3_9NEOP|nr:unnamed protein product [Danaus chrysippus]
MRCECPLRKAVRLRRPHWNVGTTLGNVLSLTNGPEYSSTRTPSGSRFKQGPHREGEPGGCYNFIGRASVVAYLGRWLQAPRTSPLTTHHPPPITHHPYPYPPPTMDIGNFDIDHIL